MLKPRGLETDAHVHVSDAKMSIILHFYDLNWFHK